MMDQLKKIFVIKIFSFTLFSIILMVIPFYKLKLDMFVEKVYQNNELLQGSSFFKRRELASLAAIPVHMKYSSKNWKFIGSNCENTRNRLQILYSFNDLEYNKNKCSIEKGSLFFPYLGKIDSIKGNRGYINVDHVIPKAYAFQYGGFKWSKEQKIKFSNDLDELIPVDPKENRFKGSKGPSDWNVPNNPDFSYDYLKRWLFISHKYQHYPLVLPQKDRDFLEKELKKLIDQSIPTIPNSYYPTYTISKNLRYFANIFILMVYDLWK